MVLAIGLFVGLGSLPLRPLAFASPLRLGLDAGPCLGAGLGHLAQRGRSLRPDHFTFIALRDFHDHDFAHHRLAPSQVTTIYNRTTIINNYTVNNNTIV